MKFIKIEKIEAIYLFHRNYSKIILVSCKSFTQLLNSKIKTEKRKLKDKNTQEKLVYNPC